MRSSTWRRLVTEKRDVIDGGALAAADGWRVASITSAFGNLIMSMVPILAGTPPSASTKNFLDASGLLTFRW